MFNGKFLLLYCLSFVRKRFVSEINFEYEKASFK